MFNHNRWHDKQDTQSFLGVLFYSQRRSVTLNHNITINSLIRWLVPAQDAHYFYTRSHLSAPQNCAVLFSTNFHIIFILKKCITQFSHWIVSCANFFQNILQLYINLTHSFVAIELLTFCKDAKKLFYSSRELSLFWPNK